MKTTTRIALSAWALIALGLGSGVLVTSRPVPVPEFPEGRTAVSTIEYDREAFPHWTDPDRNGCDARNDALAQDLEYERVARDGCTVLAGTLFDPYTGLEMQFQRGRATSSKVQIDHVVPLAWAWRHGADRWDRDTRERFANDPANLVATIGEVNQRKSDSGPDEWMPPNPAYRCAYLASWRLVTDQYDLPDQAAPGCS